MLTPIRSFVIIVVTSLFTLTAFADTVTLKDGRVIEGDFVSRDDTSLVLNVGGFNTTIPLDQIAGMTMGAATAAPAPATPAKEPVKAAPAPEPKPVAKAPPPPSIVSSGTSITIRLGQGISTRSNNSGERFSGVLESDLVASDGKVVAKRGSQIYGRIHQAKRSGRLTGKPALTLELTEIMVNNQMKAVVTETWNAAGPSATGGLVKRTAGAAAIGGLIDGSDGAKTGAKVGAGASILVGKEDININSGTLMDFRLRTPFQP
ncbi:Rho-binding antiterminator [Echinimonas agarilytica]|uniref:Rho-binding antiterminator n=1 Tax=Echinimonas agarilytica TaxID=1215918 RepID=A0AA41W4A2_9GAMM|nr:Rho-binding antiterminator [Echinimonas agarilytica]MCM2678485.1 Rho-binding antiterminator [Echinimonas agarilytica]